MDKLQIKELKDILIGFKNIDSYEDSLIVADFEEDNRIIELIEFIYGEPLRFEFLGLFMLKEGKMDVMIDYAPYTLKKNDFVVLMPSHVFKIKKIYSDAKGFSINASSKFMTQFSSTLNSRSNTISNYMEIRKNPVTNMNDDEIKTIEEDTNFIRKRIKDETHSFKKETVSNAFFNFFLDLGNIFLNKKDNFTKSSLSRKEEIMEKFLQLLVRYCRKQHNVSFYAEELYITPQYLSLILKEITGKSANKFIDEATFREAQQLLRTPNTTIQQVASELCFSDQSTFGKFFKKHSGMSPSEYKKSI
jgi:AraC-like DNA-binding protein